jgi:hypothetical protein
LWSGGRGLLDAVEYEVVDPDWMASLARVQRGEGSTGEDDEEVRGLERVSELEQNDRAVRSSGFSERRELCNSPV